jgi:hypothetical protein
MALASVKESEGVNSPPWETAPYGVVSLLTMLEFSARDYIEITYQFGKVLAILRKEQPGQIDLSEAMQKLLEEANRLGLLVTREALGEFLLEMVKTHPSNVTMRGEGADRTFYFKNADLASDRTAHHIEAIYSTLKAELRTTLFKVIPRERVRYNDAGWLKDSRIESPFPTSFRELVRGGACYSLSQPTACVFHSMRALEPALSALAKPFPHISTAHENWQNIIEQIETAVRAIGQQPKSQQKIDEEKFFGGVVSHLYFVKNAWRNHVAHARDSYSDDEAVKVLSHTLEFIESLCPRLQE